MDIRWTIYVTAQQMKTWGSAPGELEQAIKFLQQESFHGAVLESYRGGWVTDRETMRTIRDRFTAAGLETLGGLMPVYGEDPESGLPFGVPAEGVESHMNTFCYSREETVLVLEKELRKMADLFDQVVIDDAFFTTCRCAQCREAKGNRPWGEFRRDLLSQVAARWYQAVHEENESCLLTVKFPQYYDRYALLGYDAARFAAQFDRVWQGTETRDPETLAYGYVEPYEGYFNLAWMRACAKEKCTCGWFDYLDCDAEQFARQALFTGLAAPRRILLFCYSDALLSGEKMKRLRDMRKHLETLAPWVTSPKGVSVIKPPNTDGAPDLFLFDFLGMMGIPCVPETVPCPDAPVSFITAHAARHPETPGAIQQALASGRRVGVTFAALRQLPVFTQELFGYTPAGIAPGRSQVAAFEMNGSEWPVTEPFFIPGDLAEPREGEVLVRALMSGCEHGRFRIPFLTRKDHPGGGMALVWNIGTFGHEAFPVVERVNVPQPRLFNGLPGPILSTLRNTLLEELGLFLDAPYGVCLFLFEQHALLVNGNKTPLAGRITFPGTPEKSFTLPPYAFQAIPLNSGDFI